MKTTIHLISFKPTFKFVRNWFISLFVASYFLVPTSSFSQCTSYTVNWDYLDFLHNSSSSWYNGFVTNTMKQSQNYALGPTNVLNIATSMAVTGSGVFYGEITTHGGDVPGYTGADVSFNPTIGQTITFTFLNEVTNASFTLYDVDRNQVIMLQRQILEVAAQTVTATTYATSGARSITVSGTPGKTITAANTSICRLPIIQGLLLLVLHGSVKTITLTVCYSWE